MLSHKELSYQKVKSIPQDWVFLKIGSIYG